MASVEQPSELPSEDQQTSTGSPSRPMVMVLGAILVALSAALGVIGLVLPEGVVDPAGGGWRVIFAIVPVRWFAWTMAAVFFLLGARMTWRGMASD